MVEVGEWEKLESVVHHGGGSEARTMKRGDGYKRGGIFRVYYDIWMCEGRCEIGRWMEGDDSVAGGSAKLHTETGRVVPRPHLKTHATSIQISSPQQPQIYHSDPGLVPSRLTRLSFPLAHP